MERDSLTLKGIIESTNIMIAYLDLNFNFVVVNSAYANGSGYSVHELIGKNHFDLFPNKENQEIFEKIKDTGQPVKFLDKPFRFAHEPDRGITYWDWMLSPVKDDKGDVQGLVLSLMETTERKKAEDALRDSEQRFKLVAEAANVMVYDIDIVTGKIKSIRGLKELVGFEPDDVDLTVNWVASRIHPDDLPTVLPQCTEAETGKRENYSVEYRFLHKDGRYIFVKDTAIAIKDSTGKTVRLIGGARDITQRKLNQKRIEEYSKHLEKLVEDRTKQLLDYERLAAIGKVAGMVGHDIRNPMQAIVSDTFLLRLDVETMPKCNVKESIVESLDSIDKNVSYINKIVQDLQDYAKPLTPTIKEIDIEKIFDDVLVKKAVPVSIEVSRKVEAGAGKLITDPDMLKRILANLVNNAVQAMPNGGKLAVCAYRNGEDIVISVEDSGVGVPEEIKDKLFTPMFTTKAKGQGFGLPVVKRMTEALGGTVTFQSQEGKGTAFTLRFPPK